MEHDINSFSEFTARHAFGNRIPAYKAFDIFSQCHQNSKFDNGIVY